MLLYMVEPAAIADPDLVNEVQRLRCARRVLHALLRPERRSSIIQLLSAARPGNDDIMVSYSLFDVELQLAGMPPSPADLSPPYSDQPPHHSPSS